MTPKLSILICTLEKRRHYLKRLLAHLNLQKNLLENPDDLEILVESDNGEKSTGEKRNILVNRARGQMVCHWDDDDLPLGNSCEIILSKINDEIDALGINLIMVTDGGKTERSWHIGQFKDAEWFQTLDPIQPGKFNFWRGFNHINPVKRELALQVPFKHITMGEDRDYAYRLAPLIKTWVDIEQPVYLYLFRTNK